MLHYKKTFLNTNKAEKYIAEVLNRKEKDCKFYLSAENIIEV